MKVETTLTAEEVRAVLTGYCTHTLKNSANRMRTLEDGSVLLFWEPPPEQPKNVGRIRRWFASWSGEPPVFSEGAP